MELFREALDHAIQKVLLSHRILSPLNQLKHLWQHNLLVNLDIHSLQTTDPH